MSEKRNEEHFKVECQVDGRWFEGDYIFPDRDTALAFKHHEEEHGSGNSYRIVATDAAVNLPSKEGDEDEDSESSEEDSSLFSIDWSALFELAVLCPRTLLGASDGDLERMYARCEQGCCIEGRVFF